MVSILQRPTLVLNRNWQVVAVKPTYRALTMVVNGVAKIVDPADYAQYTWEDWALLEPDEGDLCIRSFKLRIRVPEVIALLQYDRIPESTVTFSRRNLFKRDHYSCQYCGRQPGSNELSIDHVIPRSSPDGLGKTTWENCVLACISCNTKKGSRTLAESGMKLQKKPIKPVWQPLYANYVAECPNWQKFLSEVYWTTKLQ